MKRPSLSQTLLIIICFVLLSGLPWGCSEINRVVADHPCQSLRNAAIAAIQASTNASIAADQANLALQNAQATVEERIQESIVLVLTCVFGPICEPILAAAAAAILLAQERRDVALREYDRLKKIADDLKKAADDARAALSACEAANSRMGITFQDKQARLKESITFLKQEQISLEKHLELAGKSQKIAQEHEQKVENWLAVSKQPGLDNLPMQAIINKAKNIARVEENAYAKMAKDLQITVKKVKLLEHDLEGLQEE
jgi:hypothetical protein